MNETKFCQMFGTGIRMQTCYERQGSPECVGCDVLWRFCEKCHVEKIIEAIGGSREHGLCHNCYKAAVLLGQVDAEDVAGEEDLPPASDEVVRRRLPDNYLPTPMDYVFLLLSGRKRIPSNPSLCRIYTSPEVIREAIVHFLSVDPTLRERGFKARMARHAHLALLAELGLADEHIADILGFPVASIENLMVRAIEFFAEDGSYLETAFDLAHNMAALDEIRRMANQLHAPIDHRVHLVTLEGMIAEYACARRGRPREKRVATILSTLGPL